MVFDWEIYSKTARSANVDKTTLTDCAIAFCDTVAMAGYTPMIYIGREVGDIHIQGDTQISREKHALVAYYAKTRSFFVGPAEGRNIVELNEEPVFNTMALKNYDIITIGATRLMFVGLCGDHFSWSEVADNA